MSEPSITINGVALTEAQAMTIRVALNSFWLDLQDNSLGDDKHGKSMQDAYQSRVREIFAIFSR